MAKNIDTKVTGTKLVISIDLAGAREGSKSGKSEVIASTHGNVEVGRTPDGRPVKLGINCYTPTA